MSVLSDTDIIRRVRSGDLCIDPFMTEQVSRGVISYGLSSAGIDLRLGRHFKVFTNARCAVVDPKNFNPASFVDVEADDILIPPNSFVLAEAVEWIRLPRDLIGLATIKSTYTRCGIGAPPTVAEPGWEGRLTLEIANSTPLPARVYAGEGAVQLLLLSLTTSCATSYADRKGKYQGQTGVTLPVVERSV